MRSDYIKKLEIYNVTDKKLDEWDNTHDKKFANQMRHPRNTFIFRFFKDFVNNLDY